MDFLNSCIDFLIFWWNIIISLIKAFAGLLCLSGFCFIVCKWISWSPKPKPIPTYNDFRHALIHEENDDKVIDLYSRLTSAPLIEQIREIHYLVSKRDNPSIIAKLQTVDPGPLR